MPVPDAESNPDPHSPNDRQTWLALAEAGDGEAMTRLANVLFAQGDRPLAEAWLRRGAASGAAIAMMVLGQRLLHGLELPAEPAEGEGWLRRAAEAGFPPAMEAWGQYRRDQAPEEAARYFRDAAEAGFPPAMVAIADCLATGTGIAPDAAAAEDWLAVATGANHGPAFTALAHLKLQIDPQAAEGLLLEALRRRDVSAGLELGLRRYARGEYEGAAKAFISCLRLGSNAARINVAAMRRRGEWPTDLQTPTLEELIGSLANTDPFAAINLALADDEPPARAVARLKALPPDTDWHPARTWWQALAEGGDPEGGRVIAWLARLDAV